MGNYCYKIMVKGPCNACYAFIGSTKSIDEPKIISETVNDKETIIVFYVKNHFPIDVNNSQHKSWLLKLIN